MNFTIYELDSKEGLFVLLVFLTIQRVFLVENLFFFFFRQFNSV